MWIFSVVVIFLMERRRFCTRRKKLLQVLWNQSDFCLALMILRLSPTFLQKRLQRLYHLCLTIGKYSA